MSRRERALAALTGAGSACAENHLDTAFNWPEGAFP